MTIPAEDLRFRLVQQPFIKSLINNYLLLFLVGRLSFSFFVDNRSARNIFYVFLFPAVFLTFKNDLKKDFWKLPIVRAIGLYICYFLASPLWADTVTAKQFFNVSRSWLFTGCFACLYAIATCKYENFLKVLKTAILIAGTVAAVYVIGQYIHQDLWPQRMNGIGMGVSPLHGPAMLGSAIFLASGFLLKEVEPKNRINYIIPYILSVFVFASYLLLSQSRGPLLAFILTTFIGLVLCKQFKTMLSLTFILTTIGSIIFFLNIDITHINRFGSQSYRIEIWQYCLDLLRNDWFLGLGYLTRFDLFLTETAVVHTPHNIFIGQIFYGGIVGLSLFLLLLGTTFFYGYRQFKEDKDPGPLLVLVHGLFSGLTNFDRLIGTFGPEWFFFWLPIGIIAGKEYRKTKAISPIVA